MAITIRVDAHEVREMVAKLGPAQTNAAIVRAFNRTVGPVTTLTAREVGQEVNLKAADIKKAITQRRASGTRPEASIRLSGKPVAIIKFIGTGQTSQGVSVKILRKGGRKTIGGAFLATTGSRLGAFRRGGPNDRPRRKPAPRRGPRPTHSQLPIDQLLSLSVAKSLARNQSRIKAIHEAAAKRIGEALGKEIKQRLAKRGP